MTEQASEKTMRERFARINEFAEKDGIVLFGSSFFAQFPIDELAQSFGVESIPMLAYIKDGKLADYSIGYVPKENVLKLIGK